MAFRISQSINYRHSNAFCSAATQRSKSHRHQGVVRAALDSSAAYAVTQQCIAFAAVVGAEAAYTGLNTPEAVPGRPTVASTLAGVGGTVVSALLISQSDSVGTAGCAIGLIAASYLMYTYIQRTINTPYDPNDWPGARSWPAMMILISFFAFMANFQGLKDGLGLISS